MIPQKNKRLIMLQKIMKNKLSGWVAGGLLAVAVFGVSLSNNNVASAAQSVPANMSMQQEKPINSDTTKEQEIQKPCCEAEGKTETSAAAGMMQSGKMPLHNYTLLHPSSKITQKDIDVIKKYTLSLASANPVKKEEKIIHKNIELPENNSESE